MIKKSKTIKGKSMGENNIITLVLSILAIVISAISVFYAFKSYDLSRLQDEESKMAIWLGSYKDEEFSFTATNETIKMQKGYVLFPSAFNEHVGYVNPPNYTMSTITFETRLTDFIDKRIERSEGHYSVVESYIPIVIQSYYVAAGKARQIQSVYNIQFIATLSEKENEYKLPEIEIRGMWFDHHLDYKENGQDYLDNIWNELLKQKNNYPMEKPL
jgi:hypothetical protein